MYSEPLPAIKNRPTHHEDYSVLLFPKITLDLFWPRTPAVHGQTSWLSRRAQAHRPGQNLSDIRRLAFGQAPAAAPGLPHQRAGALVQVFEFAAEHTPQILPRR